MGKIRRSIIFAARGKYSLATCQNNNRAVMFHLNTKSNHVHSEKLAKYLIDG